MNKLELLSSADFGERTAEDEFGSLADYFVETDNWRRLYNGSIDIVYGPKGSGKSALYALLINRTNELFDRNILLVPGEQPRGTPAFSSLKIDPPASESEFVGLWKLYILSLISSALDDFEINSRSARRLRDALAAEGLIKGNKSLASVLTSAFEYVKRFLRPDGVEGTVHLESNTQMPIGISGRIHFSEPSTKARSKGALNVEELFQLANEALDDSNLSVWVLLDRLDVAFVDSDQLEQNALRALFRVYLDLAAFDRLTIKVFLRTDIWNRITREGFREASHITRHLTIEWNKSSLLNLIVRRVLHNSGLVHAFDLDPERVLDSLEAQEGVFFRLFPGQVDIGSNKSDTLVWMLSRTKDGTDVNAPRELIHLMNALRDEQVRRLEIGEDEPDGDVLFARAAFKSALPTVSETRLTQTLYAEYPNLKPYIEKLRGLKTNHAIDSLQSIWQLERGASLELADGLVEVGFFEKRGTRTEPRYWVPFLYRDSLELVQGSADEG